MAEVPPDQIEFLKDVVEKAELRIERDVSEATAEVNKLSAVFRQMGLDFSEGLVEAIKLSSGELESTMKGTLRSLGMSAIDIAKNTAKEVAEETKKTAKEVAEETMKVTMEMAKKLNRGNFRDLIKQKKELHEAYKKEASDAHDKVLKLKDSKDRKALKDAVANELEAVYMVDKTRRGLDKERERQREAAWELGIPEPLREVGGAVAGVGKDVAGMAGMSLPGGIGMAAVGSFLAQQLMQGWKEVKEIRADAMGVFAGAGSPEVWGKSEKITKLTAESIEAREKGVVETQKEFFDVAGILAMRGRVKEEDVGELAIKAGILGEAYDESAADVATFMSSIMYTFDVSGEEAADTFHMIAESARDVDVSLEKYKEWFNSLSQDLAKYGYVQSDVNMVLSNYKEELKDTTLSVQDISKAMKGAASIGRGKRAAVAEFVMGRGEEFEVLGGKMREEVAAGGGSLGLQRVLAQAAEGRYGTEAQEESLRASTMFIETMTGAKEGTQEYEAQLDILNEAFYGLSAAMTTKGQEDFRDINVTKIRSDAANRAVDLEIRRNKVLEIGIDIAQKNYTLWDSFLGSTGDFFKALVSGTYREAVVTAGESRWLDYSVYKPPTETTPTGEEVIGKIVVEAPEGAITDIQTGQNFNSPFSTR